MQNNLPGPKVGLVYMTSSAPDLSCSEMPVVYFMLLYECSR